MRVGVLWHLDGVWQFLEIRQRPGRGGVETPEGPVLNAYDPDGPRGPEWYPPTPEVRVRCRRRHRINASAAEMARAAEAALRLGEDSVHL